MKLISLNTWMGMVGAPLLEFVKSRSKDTDIFCFQEVLDGGEKEAAALFDSKETTTLFGSNGTREHNLYALLCGSLPDHEPFFHPNKGAWAGLTMFVKKDIPILETGDIFVHGTGPYNKETGVKSSARNIQYVKIRNGEKILTIINFHGLWNGGGHEDAPERIAQSEKILEYTGSLSNDYILCGDFNLLPHTKSLAILEESGLQNLIKEYGITSTRTKLYKRSSDQYADYTLVSKGIEVNDFKVLPDEVSDHAAMYLEFE